MVWDVRTGREVLSLKGHEDMVLSVAFSPDGKRLASGSADKTIKLWDAETSREVLTLKGHEAGVLSVAFSPHGKRLASGSGNATIKVWDAETGREVITLKGPEWSVIRVPPDLEPGPRSVAFSPDGKRIASGRLDGTISIWEADEWREGR